MVSKTLSMLALAGAAVAELPPIHIKGMKFFYENGTQFYMKGIAYQAEIATAGSSTNTGNNTDYKDPLSSESDCKRDVPLLQELGVNTIRTYAIDPKVDHDKCMKLLDDAGIYVISDLSQPALAINRDEPEWNTELFTRYKDVIDALAKYKNTIGFFAGNEVSDAKNNTEASAYVKAAIRDTKKYIVDKKYRPMGVGYASNDHPDIRNEIAEYFNCGEDAEATDFWGYNIYSWCGKSSMKESGYDKWVEFFKSYNVPVFFAEYGCNAGGAKTRIYTDTEALFSDEMTGVFSGGLVFKYQQEENDYGVVEIKNGKAEKQGDFDALKKAHAKVNPTRVQEKDYNPNTGRDQCPAVGDVWKSNKNLPPTPDQTLCDCAEAASECGPADDLDIKDYGSLFGYICGEKPELCAGINGNATTGVYGAYSMCDAKAKLTYLLGAYYKDQKSSSSACDHKGKASVKKASAESSCNAAISSASAHNNQVATATGALANPTSTSTAGDSGSAGSSTSISRVSIFGNLAVALYSVVALGAGAAMIAL
ncbi:unnamed protein product [Clonostachys rosea f. rosea IK726]|uniref:1,3-beta-glucanosyltransferase n=2 Tax=Bionectria ochroleuca TaxID=29856 RepID=A0A0B7JX57_BIOOC|nr:unnamed protein product [Clonostachys rosea f. rosea IK726]